MAIGDGEFHVPVFQRPYVWTDAQVVRLLDSLLAGYSVGPLLCWDRTARTLPAAAHLAGLTFPGKNSYTKRVVIDGQQRLSALALAFHGGRFAFDFRTRSFVVDVPAGPDVLPLPLLLAGWTDGGPVSQWMRTTPDGEHKFLWLEESLGSTDMSLVFIPERWTLDRVVESYRRLATEGTPMAPDHLAAGLARLTDPSAEGGKVTP